MNFKGIHYLVKYIVPISMISENKRQISVDRHRIANSIKKYHFNKNENPLTDAIPGKLFITISDYKFSRSSQIFPNYDIIPIGTIRQRGSVNRLLSISERCVHN